jgi:hypothetical protein
MTINGFMQRAGIGMSWGLKVFLVWSCWGSTVMAEDGGASQINAGDTAWVLTSSALVLAMRLVGMLVGMGLPGR